MRTIIHTSLLLTVTLATSWGAVVEVHNIASSWDGLPRPVVGIDGAPVPAGTGYVAVGAFPDLDPADLSGGVLDPGTIAASFYELGSRTMGVDGVDGMVGFAADSSTAPWPWGLFGGQRIYVVVGDGTDLFSSTSFLIYLDPVQTFGFGEHSFASVALADAELNGLITGSVGGPVDIDVGGTPFTAPGSLVLAGLLVPPDPNSTIGNDPSQQFAYGANVGWIAFRRGSDPNPEGAIVADSYLEGFVYAANCGWIDLGRYPDDGIHYRNAGGSDFGINVDSRGNLSGFAYGANVGWINFGNPASWKNPPRLDLRSGRMSGFAWGANIGWIDLGTSGPVAVQTTAVVRTDSDRDSLPDNWELDRVREAGRSTGTTGGDLLLLGANTNRDGDSQTDAEEFAADTDPFSFDDFFRIEEFIFEGDPSDATIRISWNASENRLYDLLSATAGAGPGDFSVVESDIQGAASLISRTIGGPAPDVRKFWRIRARRALPAIEP